LRAKCSTRIAAPTPAVAVRFAFAWFAAMHCWLVAGDSPFYCQSAGLVQDWDASCCGRPPAFVPISSSHQMRGLKVVAPRLAGSHARPCRPGLLGEAPQLGWHLQPACASRPGREAGLQERWQEQQVNWQQRLGDRAVLLLPELGRCLC